MFVAIAIIMTHTSHVYVNPRTTTQVILPFCDILLKF